MSKAVSSLADLSTGAQDFAERVVAWQRRYGRHGLPWQGTRDPYRIWLSEIMLQQTQVSTVLRYYGRFLERFATVADLANAGVEEVLALWSGLGYYSRARNLHACAQAVLARHGGRFPTDAAVLESLPGIGRSTAAAIAAFSAGQRVAILDGNVKRVLARHRAFGQDVATPAGLRALWDLAQTLLPSGAGIQAYTQGLMDLGATVCVRSRPQCGHCPVQADCMAHAQGRPQDFPVKSRRMKRGVRSSVLLMALRPGMPQVLLQRRPPSGIWGGLWTLPVFDDEVQLEAALAVTAVTAVTVVGSAEGQPEAGPAWEALPTVHHALTHLDWALQPRRLWVADARGARALSAALAQALRPSVDSGLAQSAEADLCWMGLQEALACGLPAPIRVLLEAQAATLG
jgi:A/G-specific adenine glycosylase